MYPPTVKIFDKIKDRLIKNNIPVNDNYASQNVEQFRNILSLDKNHNPFVTGSTCNPRTCRFMRDGKLYKCPIDYTINRYKDKFNIDILPKSMGISIYSEDVIDKMKLLANYPIELCCYCKQEVIWHKWESSPNYDKEEWLD